jgi:hypothetical protein
MIIPKALMYLCVCPHDMLHEHPQALEGNMCIDRPCHRGG